MTSPTAYLVEAEVPGLGVLEGYTHYPVPTVSCPQPLPPCALDLDLPEARESAAFHEAGHAVVATRLGIPFVTVHLDETDVFPCCGRQDVYGVTGGVDWGRVSVQDAVTMLAAGSCAASRWLRESPYWTPARAWALEIGGLDDQATARQILKDAGLPMVYGGGLHLIAGDYWHYESEADMLLEQEWERVRRVAERLINQRHLSYAEIAG